MPLIQAIQPGLPCFPVTIGAWSGALPAGMPANAINLRALGAVTSTSIDSKVPPTMTPVVAYQVLGTFAVFKVGGVTTEVDFQIGSTADADASQLGLTDVNLTLGSALAYTAPYIINPLAARLTISMPSGNFGQLTAGQAKICFVLQPIFDWLELA